MRILLVQPGEGKGLGFRFQAVAQLKRLWRVLARRNLSLCHLQRLWGAARTLTSARWYLAGHAPALGRLAQT